MKYKIEPLADKENVLLDIADVHVQARVQGRHHQGVKNLGNEVGCRGVESEGRDQVLDKVGHVRQVVARVGDGGPP